MPSAILFHALSISVYRRKGIIVRGLIHIPGVLT